MFEHVLINQHSEEVRKVVDVEIGLHYLTQSPKGLFFVHDCQKLRCQRVHPLKVPNFGVANKEGKKDSFQRLNLILATLGIGSMQVFFDLVEVRVRILSVSVYSLYQSLIIARIGQLLT